MKSKRAPKSLLALLAAALMMAPAVGLAQQGTSLADTLIQAGQINQEIQFNPAAALQIRMFADGFVPNSGEFDLQVGGVAYRGQRAEHLRTGEVRVYYVANGNWSQVQVGVRSRPRAGSDDQVLLNGAEAKQKIQFNPGAALQQRIFADDFVPNSDEFDIVFGGASYRGQRAEHLGSGEVRIYYVPVGDWSNVMIVSAGTHPPNPVDTGTQIVVDGAGHPVGPPPVMYYALTAPDGSDVYPLGSGAYALAGLLDTGSDKVRITQQRGIMPQSDAGYLNLTQMATVNIRLNGLNTRQANGNIPIGPPGSTNSPQAEITNIVVKPVADVDVSLIGAPATNKVVVLIDYNRIIVDPDWSVRGPYMDFYLPGDSRTPGADVRLALEPAGTPVSTDGATAGQRYFLRNLAFQHAGNVVSDRDHSFDFFFDTGTTMTIIDDRIAAQLGLQRGGGNADCYTGTHNRYTIDEVTMTGAGGTYRIKHAIVCWSDTSVHGVLADAVIGANFFDQVQVVLDSPGATLGIRSAGAGGGNIVVELPAAPPTEEPTGCSGVQYNGACWYLGGITVSCDTLCASHGRYDERTRTYAGSAGSAGNCQKVLQALGVSWTRFYETSQGGIGCFIIRNTGGGYSAFWDKTATTAAATYKGRQRACACQH